MESDVQNLAPVVLEMSKSIELFKEEWFKRDGKIAAFNLSFIDVKFVDVIQYFCISIASTGKEKDIKEMSFGSNCKFSVEVKQMTLEDKVLSKLFSCYFFHRLDEKVLKRIFKIPRKNKEEYVASRAAFIKNFAKIKTTMNPWEECIKSFPELCKFITETFSKDYDEVCCPKKRKRTSQDQAKK